MTDWDEIEILPRTLGLRDHAQDTRERRELIIMRAGERLFGLYADEADSVTEQARPTPLPHAPAAVLGVVSVRGRMRTVLSPSALLGDADELSATKAARYVVSLRGDEQLALAVERVERVVEILTEDVRTHAYTDAPVRGVLTQEDASTIVLLDPARLFEAATRDVERRRAR
ncbi:MAG TPA: chemotaxis protein CheW [Pyrinomonadaceae bacterium]|nr:chemotaxis protein CheW [Pyrinomonadaceae bacterium]